MLKRPWCFTADGMPRHPFMQPGHFGDRACFRVNNVPSSLPGATVKLKFLCLQLRWWRLTFHAGRPDEYEINWEEIKDLDWNA